MKDLIYKIIFCVGAAISIAYAFIPAGEGIFENASIAFNLILNDPAALMGFENIEIFNNVPVILSILIFWFPVILLIASIVLIFAMPKRKISLILTMVASVIFIASDIICLINDIVFVGIFINLIGVILALVGEALFFIGDEDDDNGSETICEGNECVAGEITCISGEYAGGKFYINDKLVIGHDASRCNIILSNRTISKIHCIITYVTETDTYTIKDVSRNGTFFADGKRLVKNFNMQVPRLTEIYMGETKERFILD